MPTDEFIPRPATEADDSEIRRLIREGQINPMGLDWQRFRVIHAPPGDVTPEGDAPSLGGIIACGQIKPHTDGSQELASITVDSRWRGRGHARRMMEQLLGEHPGTLYLMCESSLETFYQKFGFFVITEAEYPKYFRRMKKLMSLPEKLGGFEILIMRRAGADA